MAGVIATLKLQFAKTMSLAVSISDNIRKPAVSRGERERMSSDVTEAGTDRDRALRQRGGGEGGTRAEGGQ
eukprot:747705-Hanusia_phi.AAC.3